MSEPSPRDATGSSDATRPRPPHRGPPRPRTRPGSRAWGGRGGRPRESPPRVSSGTPCTCVAPFRARRCFAAFRARRCSSPRTPCTGFAASRARRCSSPRTPCTCFAPSRARRCFLLRTPCTGFAASRARRCSSPRTPCTGVEPSRARRCSSPRTPCTGFAASRARRCSSPRTPCSCVAPSRARRCPSPRTPCTCFAASRARRFLSPGTPCRNTLPPLPAVHARPIAPRPRGRARTLSEGRCHGGTRGGCDARLRRRARGTQPRPGRSTPSVNNASSRARLTTPPDCATAARRPLTRFTRSAAPSACRCIPREL